MSCRTSVAADARIGIRVALGAGRQSVIGMGLVSQALVLVGIGSIAIGSAAALELGACIRAMLFQLQPTTRSGRSAWSPAGLAIVACSRHGSPRAAR